MADQAVGLLLIDWLADWLIEGWRFKKRSWLRAYTLKRNFQTKYISSEQESLPYKTHPVAQLTVSIRYICIHVLTKLNLKLRWLYPCCIYVSIYQQNLMLSSVDSIHAVSMYQCITKLNLKLRSLYPRCIHQFKRSKWNYHNG